MADHARRTMKLRHRAKHFRSAEQAAISLRADASEHFQLTYAASPPGLPSPSLESTWDSPGPQPKIEISSEPCLPGREQKVVTLENKISRLEKANAGILSERSAMRKRISGFEGAASKAVKARKTLEQKVTGLEMAKNNAEKAFSSPCQEYGENIRELNSAMHSILNPNPGRADNSTFRLEVGLGISVDTAWSRKGEYRSFKDAKF